MVRARAAVAAVALELLPLVVIVIVLVGVALALLAVAGAPLALLVGADHHFKTGRIVDAARPASRGYLCQRRYFLYCSSS